MNILITGGAGFIGTHLARYLLKEGHEIVVLDNFLSQVHGGSSSLASDISQHVRLIRGDISNETALRDALVGAEGIVHLAAETGTGQSMYEVSRYETTNLHGTALIYDLLTKQHKKTIERIVVASSRSIYGEGAYLCESHGLVYPASRTTQDKRSGHFDPLCPKCGVVGKSVPTPETATLQPTSFYGLTKQVQEQMVLMFGKVLNVPSVGLRYQNVYGPGQSLKNPYTGILAIFSNLARMKQKLQVFEDGEESRDFVYIDDVVRATAQSLLAPIEGSISVNVGSGKSTSVLEVANGINSFYGGGGTVQVTGDFRDGDIRHGTADLARARELLAYEPKWSFSDGLQEFLKWAEHSEPETGQFDQSLQELKQRGLLHGSK